MRARTAPAVGVGSRRRRRSPDRPQAESDTALISLVVAAARNGTIGEHNALPWRLPSELKRFKEITLGHPVVMGRKTWEGIGRPLPGRDNIVLTRGPAIAVDGVVTVRTLDEALAVGREHARRRGVAEVMVIGGGQVYLQALPLAGRIYLTRVDMDVSGDTFFPELDPSQWREVAREVHQPGPKDSAGFTILTLDRV